jgi:hypothetical protein
MMQVISWQSMSYGLPGPSFAQGIAADGGVTRLKLSTAIAFTIINRPLKAKPYEHHDNAQPKAAHINWPILAFWLTYFGIMLGILCGIISGCVIATPNRIYQTPIHQPSSNASNLPGSFL